ncbi:hypothetical protein HDU67_009005 [Dinochytrium kinnereticum]|nr:hypothetical protein HDU67_009005 [Dinochytrium kinnereticum]
MTSVVLALLQGDAGNRVGKPLLLTLAVCFLMLLFPGISANNLALRPVPTLVVDDCSNSLAADSQCYGSPTNYDYSAILVAYASHSLFAKPKPTQNPPSSSKRSRFLNSTTWLETLSDWYRKVSTTVAGRVRMVANAALKKIRRLFWLLTTRSLRVDSESSTTTAPSDQNDANFATPQLNLNVASGYTSLVEKDDSRHAAQTVGIDGVSLTAVAPIMTLVNTINEIPNQVDICFASNFFGYVLDGVIMDFIALNMPAMDNAKSIPLLGQICFAPGSTGFVLSEVSSNDAIAPTTDDVNSGLGISTLVDICFPLGPSVFMGDLSLDVAAPITAAMDNFDFFSASADTCFAAGPSLILDGIAFDVVDAKTDAMEKNDQVSTLVEVCFAPEFPEFVLGVMGINGISSTTAISKLDSHSASDEICFAPGTSGFILIGMSLQVIARNMNAINNVFDFSAPRVVCFASESPEFALGDLSLDVIAFYAAALNKTHEIHTLINTCSAPWSVEFVFGQTCIDANTSSTAIVDQLFTPGSSGFVLGEVSLESLDSNTTAMETVEQLCASIETPFANVSSNSILPRSKKQRKIFTTTLIETIQSSSTFDKHRPFAQDLQRWEDVKAHRRQDLERLGLNFTILNHHCMITFATPNSFATSYFEENRLWIARGVGDGVGGLPKLFQTLIERLLKGVRGIEEVMVMNLRDMLWMGRLRGRTVNVELRMTIMPTTAVEIKKNNTYGYRLCSNDRRTQSLDSPYPIALTHEPLAAEMLMTMEQLAERRNVDVTVKPRPSEVNGSEEMVLDGVNLQDLGFLVVLVVALCITIGMLAVLGLYCIISIRKGLSEPLTALLSGDMQAVRLLLSCE